jgi:hypothetical protein
LLVLGCTEKLNLNTNHKHKDMKLFSIVYNDAHEPGAVTKTVTPPLHVEYICDIIQ